MLAPLVEKIYAYAIPDIAPTGTVNTDANIKTLVTNILTIVFYVAGVLAVVYLIYSGILYITAAGNPDSAKKGQQGIINAIIGIIIVILAIVIVTAVSNSIDAGTGKLK